ncbi:sensor histidine kinase [Nocardia noduli]|uniref:sensor histidine kinase n=1 Tax=Nocardia noduli TaxID=2815722 RepID=UPI001C236EDA|nr:nitrate- and nitrite sensing domain-containing protein [Nocardia noduli]
MRPRTIRGQLARIVLVSLALVSALLGSSIARYAGDYRDSGDTVDAVALALTVQDVLHEAQRERGLSNGWLGGDGRLQNAVVDQRGNTDRALRALDDAMAGTAPGTAQVRSAVGQFAALGATRVQIDARRIARPAAFQFYTDGINALNHLRLGLDQASDAEVRHGLQTLYALGEAKEQTARQRGFLNGVFAAEEFAPGEYVQFLDIRAAKVAALSAFARDATPPQQSMLDAALLSENAVQATESENVAIESAAGPLVRKVDAIAWWSQMTAVIDQERAVQQTIGDSVRARAAELRRDAALWLGGLLVVALIAIAAEIALVLASMRAIVRPLAALAAEADEVASHRLPDVIAAWHTAGDTPPDPPEPVRVPSGAGIEIAAVAGALDRVQATAFELASQQAVLRRNSTESMSNLARRNQNLVRRQLGLISEFEKGELDPKTLSNLFELDHLATRMRRNAESLLVLVGSESPRRWAEPIPLVDVIRAGLSEVDDYRRVVLRRIDDVTVTGAVVSELAHILAELIENGLAFSPPDMEVEVHGRKTGNDYVIAVVDHGVGMSADHLAEANARLRGDRDFLVAPTRYLGHYVVGRLAGRHGIDIELNTSPVSGIVARLRIPPEILVGNRGQSGESAPTGESSVPHDSSTSDSADFESGVLVAARPSDDAKGEAHESGERRPAHSAPADDAPGSAAAAARNGWASGTPAHAAGTSRTSRRADDPAATTSAPVSSVSTGRSVSGHDENRNRHDIASPSEAGRVAPSTGTDSTPRAAEQPAPSTTAWWNVADEESPAAEPAPPVERTRNGLVKRVKRNRGAAAPAARPMPPRPPSTPVPDRSPDEVRGMLSAFRTGMQKSVQTDDRPPANRPSSSRPTPVESPAGPVPPRTNGPASAAVPQRRTPVTNTGPRRGAASSGPAGSVASDTPSRPIQTAPGSAQGQQGPSEGFSRPVGAVPAPGDALPSATAQRPRAEVSQRPSAAVPPDAVRPPTGAASATGGVPQSAAVTVTGEVSHIAPVPPTRGAPIAAASPTGGVSPPGAVSSAAAALPTGAAPPLEGRPASSAEHARPIGAMPSGPASGSGSVPAGILPSGSAGTVSPTTGPRPVGIVPPAGQRPVGIMPSSPGPHPAGSLPPGTARPRPASNVPAEPNSTESSGAARTPAGADPSNAAARGNGGVPAFPALPQRSDAVRSTAFRGQRAPSPGFRAPALEAGGATPPADSPSTSTGAVTADELSRRPTAAPRTPPVRGGQLPRTWPPPSAAAPDEQPRLPQRRVLSRDENSGATET